ncbi:MAG: Maf family protein [Zhongshania sp.]|uniref:Maf family protein n=1 Tax=Zhongshania sp. TaxID=1971902 RepID=UPI002627682D|nr:Maf family protein [Zhongshania sp.]MDF1693039.1 Maf family protein [Zhongshania sp.]
MAETVILASKSPRRAELLQQIGLRFEVIAADIDETPAVNEGAQEYVRRMAVEKAMAVVALAPNRAVLAADTSVILDGEILGKPESRRHAEVMLSRLSGRSHQVMTAVALYAGGTLRQALAVTEVTFAVLSPAQIRAYLATGEADDKAGSYGIQGAAGYFVQHLSGSYSGVVGLPLYETAALLSEAGIGLA